jgi:hypothetical protein
LLLPPITSSSTLSYGSKTTVTLQRALEIFKEPKKFGRGRRGKKKEEKEAEKPKK